MLDPIRFLLILVSFIMLCAIGAGALTWHESNQKQECRMAGGEIRILDHGEWSCTGLKQGSR